MTGRPGDRIQATQDEANASSNSDAMDNWLDNTFSKADDRSKEVSFEYAGASEIKWINGVEKALSRDYANVFKAITVDLQAVGAVLASKSKGK